jgi:hypothetical protein
LDTNGTEKCSGLFEDHQTAVHVLCNNRASTWMNIAKNLLFAKEILLKMFLVGILTLYLTQGNGGTFDVGADINIFNPHQAVGKLPFCTVNVGYDFATFCPPFQLFVLQSVSFVLACHE